MEYEVLMLRKACEEFALKNVILSARLDDLEARFEHVRMMAFNACAAVSGGEETNEDPVCPHCNTNP